MRIFRLFKLVIVEQRVLRIVEIDHNAGPRIAGRGSAVFLHLARADFSPTAGCVSMTKSSMLRLLRRLGRGADARSAFEAARGLAPSAAERRFLTRRIDG